MLTGRESVTPRKDVGDRPIPDHLYPHNFAGKPNGPPDKSTVARVRRHLSGVLDTAKGIKLDSDTSLPWEHDKNGRLYATDSEKLKFQAEWLRKKMGLEPEGEFQDAKHQSDVVPIQTGLLRDFKYEALMNAAGAKLIKVETKLALQQAEIQFRHEFLMWMVGDGPDKEYDKCWWVKNLNLIKDPIKKRNARKTLLSANPHITLGVVESQDMMGLRTKYFLDHLFGSVPKTDEEFWLWYKFIIRGRKVNFDHLFEDSWSEDFRKRVSTNPGPKESPPPAAPDEPSVPDKDVVMSDPPNPPEMHPAPNPQPPTTAPPPEDTTKQDLDRLAKEKAELAERNARGSKELKETRMREQAAQDQSNAANAKLKDSQMKMQQLTAELQSTKEEGEKLKKAGESVAAQAKYWKQLAASSDAQGTNLALLANQKIAELTKEHSEKFAKHKFHSEDQINHLKATTKQLSAANEQLKKQLDSAQKRGSKRLSEDTQRVDALVKQMDDMKQVYERSQLEKKQMEHDLKKVQKDMASEIRALASGADNLKAALLTEQHNAANKEQEIRQLRHQINALTSEKEGMIRHAHEYMHQQEVEKAQLRNSLINEANARFKSEEAQWGQQTQHMLSELQKYAETRHTEIISDYQKSNLQKENAITIREQILREQLTHALQEIHATKQTKLHQKEQATDVIESTYEPSQQTRADAADYIAEHVTKKLLASSIDPSQLQKNAISFLKKDEQQSIEEGLKKLRGKEEDEPDEPEWNPDPEEAAYYNSMIPVQQMVGKMIRQIKKDERIFTSWSAQELTAIAHLHISLSDAMASMGVNEEPFIDMNLDDAEDNRTLAHLLMKALNTFYPEDFINSPGGDEANKKAKGEERKLVEKSLAHIWAKYNTVILKQREKFNTLYD